MRVALYARVSTVGLGQDPNVQLRELREYVALRKWTTVEEYVDAGHSGAKQSRPRLDQLMKDAHRRRFDAIVVWRLDRFGRSLKHLVNALDDLKALDVVFISLKDNLDLSTPTGRLMFHVIAAMTEFERNLIQERVCSGLRNAKAKGKRLGRPRTVVNVEAVRRYRSKGLSWAEVASKMGVAKSVCMRAGR